MANDRKMADMPAADDIPAAEQQNNDDEAPIVLTARGVSELVRRACMGMAVNVTLQVLHVFKFFGDSEYKLLDGGNDQVYGFDVVLSDGKKKVKCVLSPVYNTHVKMGNIRASSVIRVTGTDQRFNETETSPYGVIVIRGFEVVKAVCPLYREHPLDSAYEYYSYDRHPNEVIHCPLLGRRSYYLNDDNVVILHPPEDDPTHPIADNLHCRNIIDRFYANDPQSKELAVEEAEAKVLAAHLREGTADCMTITDVLQRGKEMTPYKKALVGRIISVSNVHHFATPNIRNKYPLKFEVCIVDSTGHVNVVVWNSLVRKYLRLCQIGDIIAVHNFQVKPTRSSKNSAADHKVQFECSLNPGKAKILFLSSAVVSCETVLPMVRSDFSLTTIEHIKELADNRIIGVVGVLVTVGRLQRQRVTVGHMQQYRWISLADHTCDELFSVKLCVKSQDDPVLSLVRGEIILCTNVRIMTSNPVHGSHDIRSICGLSTAHTGVVRHDVIDRIVDSQELDDVYDWRRTVQPNTIRKLKPLYRWTHVYERWRQMFPTKGLTPIRDLTEIVNRIAVGQFETILVQGYISDVGVRRRGLGIDDTLGDKGGRKRRKMNENAWSSPASERVTQKNCGNFVIEDLNRETFLSVSIRANPLPHVDWGSDDTVYAERKLVDHDGPITLFVRTLARLMPQGSISDDEWAALCQERTQDGLAKVTKDVFKQDRFLFTLDLFRASGSVVDATLTTIFAIQ